MFVSVSENFHFKVSFIIVSFSAFNDCSQSILFPQQVYNKRPSCRLGFYAKLCTLSAMDSVVVLDQAFVYFVPLTTKQRCGSWGNWFLLQTCSWRFSCSLLGPTLHTDHLRSLPLLMFLSSFLSAVKDLDVCRRYVYKFCV